MTKRKRLYFSIITKEQQCLKNFRKVPIMRSKLFPPWTQTLSFTSYRLHILKRIKTNHSLSIKFTLRPTTLKNNKRNVKFESPFIFIINFIRSNSNWNSARSQSTFFQFCPIYLQEFLIKYTYFYQRKFCNFYEWE